jgi:hypothetical protein
VYKHPIDLQQGTLTLESDINRFTVQRVGTRSFRQSSEASEQTFYVKFNSAATAPDDPEIGLGDLSVHLKVMFETLIEEIKKDYGTNSWVRLFIQHPRDNFKIVIPPRYIRDFSPEDVMFYIERVLHSAQFVPADEELIVALGVVKSLSGRARRPIRHLETDITAKRSIVQIKNREDNLCLPRSIVVALASLRKNQAKGTDRYPELYRVYDRIKRHKNTLQVREAWRLHKAVGFNEGEEGLIEHIPLYEDHLKVGISVISTEALSTAVYNGNSKFPDRIFILHSIDRWTGQGHFDCITKITGLMCRQNYCQLCNKAYQNRGTHSCTVCCGICGFENCRVGERISCSRCNRECRSKMCLVRHQKGYVGKSGKHVEGLCSQKWLCPVCKVMILDSPDSQRVKNHACGETWCSVCNQYFLDRHRCFMKIEKERESANKFIFFDFECMQEDDIHKPNLVVCQTCCSLCEGFSVKELSHCDNCGFRCQACSFWNKKEKTFEKSPCALSARCGKRRFHWYGVDTRDKFCNWLLSEQNKCSKIFAHNARSYDAYFILAYLKDQGKKPNQVIMTGSKIMYLKMGDALRIELLDSLNFFPMPLASLPKSFGLTELKKGFFPHFFNTLENQNVVLDKLPAMEFYGPDRMSNGRRDEFLKWYQENRNQRFDFQQELLDYCISDVNILHEACVKFRRLVLRQTSDSDLEIQVPEFGKQGIDPFNYITIASLCLGIFRTKFLPEQHKVLLKSGVTAGCTHGYLCSCLWSKGRKVSLSSPLEVLNASQEWVVVHGEELVTSRFISSPIATVPPDEYGVKGNHSSLAIEWLILEQHRLKQSGSDGEIQHVRNGGEYVVQYKSQKGVSRYLLDGYWFDEKHGKKHAYEFYGCNWHGCPSCFPGNREEQVISGKSLNQVFRDTKMKEERLLSMGFELHTMWQCCFERLKDGDPAAKTLLSTIPIVTPLRLRDSYYGGRTNGIVLHKEMHQGERGLYMDFTSLYPSVLKYEKYPVGHPVKLFNPKWKYTVQICTEEECNYLGKRCQGFHIELPFFGIAKVTMLPPQNLLYPVLPIKMGCGKSLKLLFPLCFTCAEKQETAECKCTNEKRQFTQTYCTPEINFAVSCGYEIIHVHEILHWEKSEQYNRETKSGGLFTDYINSFLKMKQEASGFPKGVCSEEEQESYIRQYFKREGILLEKENIKTNPGLRSLAKLALNSFYGKFGQRTNLRKTKFVTELSELVSLLLDRTKCVNDFSFLSENVMQVDFTPSEDFEAQAANSNVPIAAFCTCYARLALLGVMNKLEGRVLYHDTDSVIFTTKPGEFVPETGKYLGDLTDELTCTGVGCSKQNCDSNHFIVEFVSCGPKNYAYRLNTGEVFCKVRGFSLNYMNSRVINFEAMKSALFSWMRKDPTDLITVTSEIRRDKSNVKIVNKRVSKHYAVVFDKRVVRENYETVPFGFQQKKHKPGNSGT